MRPLGHFISSATKKKRPTRGRGRAAVCHSLIGAVAKWRLSGDRGPSCCSFFESRTNSCFAATIRSFLLREHDTHLEFCRASSCLATGLLLRFFLFLCETGTTHPLHDPDGQYFDLPHGFRTFGAASTAGYPFLWLRFARSSVRSPSHISLCWLSLERDLGVRPVRGIGCEPVQVSFGAPLRHHH